MKELTKKQKIIITISALVLILGIIIIMTIGLNFDLKFQETNKIELYIGKEFNIKDIKKITDEVFSKQKVMIQKVEVYEDTVSITTKEITEEQKNNIINKVNEKYETKILSDDVKIAKIPHTRGRDLIEPYIFPFMIATIITIIYLAINYYKLGMCKTIGKAISISILTQALLFSIIAITRIPIGRITIPLVITVYMLTLIAFTTKLEKDKKELEEKEE